MKGLSAQMNKSHGNAQRKTSCTSKSAKYPQTITVKIRHNQRMGSRMVASVWVGTRAKLKGHFRLGKQKHGSTNHFSVALPGEGRGTMIWQSAINSNARPVSG